MEFIIGLVILVVVVFLIRAFGAWMLRIDEVINVQKEILKEIKKYSENSNNIISTVTRKTNVCNKCGTVIQPMDAECQKCGAKSEK
jgi:anaerobic ribonucleoside-triphosphate reductase